MKRSNPASEYLCPAFREHTYVVVDTATPAVAKAAAPSPASRASAQTAPVSPRKKILG